MRPYLEEMRRDLPKSEPYLVDVNVIMGAPVSHLQSGIGDTISKYTVLYDWKLDAAHRGGRRTPERTATRC